MKSFFYFIYSSFSDSTQWSLFFLMEGKLNTVKIVIFLLLPDFFKFIFYTLLPLSNIRFHCHHKSLQFFHRTFSVSSFEKWECSSWPYFLPHSLIGRSRCTSCDSEKKLGNSFIKIIRSIIIYHFVFFAADFSSSFSSTSFLSVMFIILWSFPTIADDAELKKIGKRKVRVDFSFYVICCFLCEAKLRYNEL